MKQMQRTEAEMKTRWVRRFTVTAPGLLLGLFVMTMLERGGWRIIVPLVGRVTVCDGRLVAEETECGLGPRRRRAFIEGKAALLLLLEHAPDRVELWQRVAVGPPEDDPEPPAVLAVAA